MRKRLSAMTNNGRFHTAEALASARTRVTERAFNCKHFGVAALRRGHKMLWFALNAYLEAIKKRVKTVTYESFNIIAVIRPAFSHAPRAYLAAPPLLSPPLILAAPPQMLRTSPHTPVKKISENPHVHR